MLLHADSKDWSDCASAHAYLSLYYTHMLFCRVCSAAGHFSNTHISPSYFYQMFMLLFEPPHDKTNKMTCAPSRDLDQPGHSLSLISWGPNVSSCGRRRLWSVWVDVQADLSIGWAHRSFCWFCHEATHLWLWLWQQDNIVLQLILLTKAVFVAVMI